MSKVKDAQSVLKGITDYYTINPWNPKVLKAMESFTNWLDNDADRENRWFYSHFSKKAGVVFNAVLGYDRNAHPLHNLIWDYRERYEK